LTADEIENVKNLISNSPIQEFTIEVNPKTVDRKKIVNLAKTSVNRISLGVQSFIDKELKLLGRKHSVADSIETFHLFRNNGFSNISIDIMYGLPKQTNKDVLYNLEIINSLKPEHLSLYCLSLDSKRISSFPPLPNDETTYNFYSLYRKGLKKMGYRHYELSNFAVKGFESVHNSAYWELKEYLGLGAGAHGFVKNKRYFNADNLDVYATECVLFPNAEVQNSEQIKQDYIIQGLRMKKGINLLDYQTKFNEAFTDKYSSVLKKREKYLNINKNSVSLKVSVYFVSNEIMIDFLD
jgi:oxygen-independent coproporphyrinogen-3 oxidase